MFLWRENTMDTLSARDQLAISATSLCMQIHNRPYAQAGPGQCPLCQGMVRRTILPSPAPIKTKPWWRP